MQERRPCHAAIAAVLEKIPCPKSLSKTKASLAHASSIPRRISTVLIRFHISETSKLPSEYFLQV
jgi:hypothetical protein